MSVEGSLTARLWIFTAHLVVGLALTSSSTAQELSIMYPPNKLSTSKSTVRIMGRLAGNDFRDAYVRSLSLVEQGRSEPAASDPVSATVAGNQFLSQEIELTKGSNLLQISSARVDESLKQVIVTQESIVVYRTPAMAADGSASEAEDAFLLIRQMNLPGDGIADRSPFLLEGTLTDPQLVRGVEVNGVRANIAGDRFTTLVLVNPGTNTLDFRVQDVNGVLHHGADWLYGRFGEDETRLFERSAHPLIVCEPQDYAYCRVDFVVENRDRYVWGDVNAECPITVHSVPFGNWGVDSSFGSRQDGRQFMGWMWADWSNGGLYDDPEWNSCTRVTQRGSPLYYNHDANTTQWSPDPSPYGNGFAVLGSWKKDNGCLAIQNYTLVVGGSVMTLYELDKNDRDDRIGSLYYGSLVATQPFSGCSYTGCSGGQITPWVSKIQHEGEWDSGEAKIRAVVSRPPRVYYRREDHCGQ